MSENPYAPPQAEVDVPATEAGVPDEILKKIRNAWIAGLISAGVTLAVTLFAIFGSSILGFTAWELLDVALMLGLTFGIYKKSRVCALLMLAYFILSKIILFSRTGQANGGILAVIFLYYYAQGAYGTFVYHKLVANREQI